MIRLLVFSVIIYAITVVVIVSSAYVGARERSEQSGNERMHINFERSGGFAGIRLTTTLDSEGMSSEEAGKLRDLIGSSGFFDLPSTISKTRPGADRFAYTLTVETEEQRQTVEISEGAVPSSLRPLLDWLTAKAKERR